MIKHVVCWNIKDAKTNAPLLKEKLDALTEQIPEVQSLEVGINSKKANPENYDVVLVSTFADFDALKSYAGHPEHLKVVDFLKSIKLDRVAVDYEV